MEIRQEISLKDFEFWSGAQDTVKHLTYEDLEEIEYNLEEVFHAELPTGSDINDIFWFERDLIATCLGYEDWEDLLEDKGAY